MHAKIFFCLIVFVCSSNPLDEVYRLAEMTGTRPDLTEEEISWITEQHLLDIENARFAPNLNSTFENTPLGNLTLGRCIHKGGYSTVFEIEKFPDILIKYETHSIIWDELPLMHSMMRNFYYGRAAAEIGVGPDPLFLSPGVSLPLNKTLKANFRMPSTQWSFSQSLGLQVRYMLMRRVRGLELWDSLMIMPQARMPMNLALRIGVQLISTLEKLHSKNIVHGDIHGGNVMMKFNSSYPLGVEIDLIDFQLSRRDLPDNTTIEKVNVPGERWNAFMSPGELYGYGISKRDDIQRAIFLIAWIMNDDGYSKFMEYMRRQHWQTLVLWKEKGNFFTYPSAKTTPFDGTNIDMDDGRQVWQLLTEVLRYYQKGFPTNKRVAIDYKFIIDRFSRAVELLEKKYSK